MQQDVILDLQKNYITGLSIINFLDNILEITMKVKACHYKAKISAISMIIIFCGFAVIFAIDPILIDIIVGLIGLTAILYISFRVPTKNRLYTFFVDK